jgi:mitochondrial FAD-linked sulfhydryl oxidase
MAASVRLKHIFASGSTFVGMGLVTRSFCETPKVPTASKNPADCENPACHSTLEMFKLAKKRKTVISVAKKSDNPYEEGCPATRGQLGDSTWQLIHTVAANYPENPSPEDKKFTFMFFESLAMVYPCPHCAEDFQQSFKRSPAE